MYATQNHVEKTIWQAFYFGIITMLCSIIFSCIICTSFARAESIGYIFPLLDPVFVQGKIVCTSWFTKERTENGKTYQYKALNYPCKYGATIVSPADGVVTYTQIDGYEGALLVIRFDDGTECSIAHLSKYLVLDGQRVFKGQQIARAGKSGRTTGVHLRVRFSRNGEVLFCNAQTWGKKYGDFEYVGTVFKASDAKIYR